MENDEKMMQTELYLILSLLADTIESKAESADDAVKIIREKAKEVKPTK